MRTKADRRQGAALRFLWLSTINSHLSTFSPGPTTRQYPAIPGNTRTMTQFLAAYCRLTVRVLPRIQFSCRVKSPLSFAFATLSRCNDLTPNRLSMNPRQRLLLLTAYGSPLTIRGLRTPNAKTVAQTLKVSNFEALNLPPGDFRKKCSRDEPQSRPRVA